MCKKVNRRDKSGFMECLDVGISTKEKNQLKLALKSTNQKRNIFQKKIYKFRIKIKTTKQ